MLESSTPAHSLERHGRPFGTGRSSGNPFTSAPRARREGQEALEEPAHQAGGRRRAQAEKHESRTERRERRWLEEQTRGTRREERASQEEARANERWKEQRTESAEPRTRTRTQGAGSAPQLETARAPQAAQPPIATSEVTPLEATAQPLEELATPVGSNHEGEPSPIVSPLSHQPLAIERTALAQRGGGGTALVGGQATPASNTAAANSRGAVGVEGSMSTAKETKSAGETARAESREPQPAPAPADTGRAAEVLRQFRMQLHPGLKTAVIELMPAELGRIRIEMKLDGAKLHAVVRAERPEALAALEEHLPELRSALEQQGLAADDLDLGLGFAGGRDAQPEGFGRSGGSSTEVVEPEIDQGSLARAVARRAGVDFYA